MKKRSLEEMHPWPLIRPARTGSRWMSVLIDWTLLVLFAVATGFVLVFWFARLNTPYPFLTVLLDSPRVVLSLLLLWAVAVSVGCWGYFFLLRAACGSTFGESLWGIRLLRDDGRSAGPKAMFVRGFAALISLAPLGAGFWLRFFHSQGRSWHDRMSGTQAVQFWPHDVDPRSFRNA